MGEFLKNPLTEVRRDEGVRCLYKKHKKGYVNMVGRLLPRTGWEGPHETPLAR